MNKIVAAVLALICLISIAYGIEYSANVINPAERLFIEIDCPFEVQEKSEFMVNASITNLQEENITDVIVELVAPKKDFSYSQPKQRIKEIDGNTQTMVSWNVRAKRPGSYNITAIVTGEAEITGLTLSAQDQEMIIVTNTPRSLIDIIRSLILRKN